MKLIKIKDIIEKIILVFLFNWFQIIFSIEFLSIFNKVTPLWLIISHLIIAVICIIISIKNKLSLKLDIRYLTIKFVNFFKEDKSHKSLKIIIAICLLIITTTLFIGFSVPPKKLG